MFLIQTRENADPQIHKNKAPQKIFRDFDIWEGKQRPSDILGNNWCHKTEYFGYAQGSRHSDVGLRASGLVRSFGAYE